MPLEVLTIGDEILSGNITDTNFAWLGDRLWSAGFDLHGHTTVGDEPSKIAAALLAAVGRSEAVIVTGGLGPTLDDITLEVAANTFGLPLKLNNQAVEEMRSFFLKLGRTMTDSNRKQAFLPEGSVMISNRVGTAPGCHLDIKGTHFFFLPGVPREMKQQFEEAVLPWLTAHSGSKREFYCKVLRCFGKPEATIAQRLEGVDLEGVDLAYRPAFPEILIKVSAWGEERPGLERRVGEVEREIRGRLGEVVYGEGDCSFPQVVGDLLASRDETLAVAESCTGGRLASLITDVPGSSRYFERGVVTYSNASKTELIGVPDKLIETFGAVSSEVAVAMAKGIRRQAKTTYGLGVTGVAGPTGGTAEKPVGTVHIALDADAGSFEREIHFPTNREWFKMAVSFSALDLVRRHLLGVLR